MSTFSVWWKALLKSPQVRAVTWVCGPERVLVEDVVTIIKNLVNVPETGFISLTVGDTPERDIWQEVFTYPPGFDARRLVVVRGAEKLNQPEMLLRIPTKAKAHPGCFAVFVSGDDSVPRFTPEGEQNTEVVPWLAKLGNRAHVVECKPFTENTAKVAVEWVIHRVGMRENVAGYLLNRADGNLRLVRDTCAKLSVLEQEPTIAAVNDLLSAQPRDSFADALIAMDKRGALQALEKIPPTDYSRTLGILDSSLELAGMIHDMQLEHRPTGEILRRAGNKSFLVRDLIPVSKHYSRKRRAVSRRVLVRADEALRGGETTGVLEAVVALW